MPLTRRELLLSAGAALAAPAAALAGSPERRAAAPAVLKGRALRPGGTIGIAAPASPVSESVLRRGTAALEARGFRVKLGAHVREACGFFAGTAEQRAEDINALFADPEVDAILCAKGGYGTAAILDLLDYGTIAGHPKQLIGYSDITGLETAIWQKTGLITINGPMLRSLRGEDSYTEENFFRGITTLRPMGAVVPPEGELAALCPGRASGRIVGGNLTLIASLAGTPYELKGDGCILVLEEVGEKSYRIDRHASAAQPERALLPHRRPRLGRLLRVHRRRRRLHGRGGAAALVRGCRQAFSLGTSDGPSARGDGLSADRRHGADRGRRRRQSALHRHRGARRSALSTQRHSAQKFSAGVTERGGEMV